MTFVWLVLHCPWTLPGHVVNCLALPVSLPRHTLNRPIPFLISPCRIEPWSTPGAANVNCTGLDLSGLALSCPFQLRNQAKLMIRTNQAPLITMTLCGQQRATWPFQRSLSSDYHEQDFVLCALLCGDYSLFSNIPQTSELMTMWLTEILFVKHRTRIKTRLPLRTSITAEKSTVGELNNCPQML